MELIMKDFSSPKTIAIYLASAVALKAAVRVGTNWFIAGKLMAII